MIVEMRQLPALPVPVLTILHSQADYQAGKHGYQVCTFTFRVSVFVKNVTFANHGTKANGGPTPSANLKRDGIISSGGITHRTTWSESTCILHPIVVV